MVERQIPVGNLSNINELIKSLSFAAEEIININVNSEFIEIKIEENKNIDEVNLKINKIINKYMNTNEIKDTTIYEKDRNIKFTDYNELLNSRLIKNYGEGLIALKEEATKLYKYFDKVFCDFALQLNGNEVKYPSLLPINVLKKTGYLRNSPQYSTFCCHPKEDIDELSELQSNADKSQLLSVCNEPQYAIAPAACFHCYMDLENKTLDKPSVFTIKQDVCRNEGRLNWNEFGRLRNFHMREIVFIGDSEFVLESREKVLEKTKEFVEKLGLSYKICITHDPFVIPAMQKFKKVQIMEESKYELQLEYAKGKYMAVASFNYHGTAFTSPFNISVNHCDVTTTGCVGFGLERWVLAYMSEFGYDPCMWSQEIISKLNELE